MIFRLQVVDAIDGTRCWIPAWMLDPIACSAITQESVPRISIAALQTLRALLDGQPLFALSASEHDEASFQKGGTNDAKTQSESEANDVSLGHRQLDLEKSSGESAEPLPGTVGPTVQDRRPAKSQRKDQE